MKAYIHLVFVCVLHWEQAVGGPKTGSARRQADVRLRAAEAPVAFGVDGSGVGVGIIADGTNDRTAAQFSRALPATVTAFRPCDPEVARTSCHTGTATLELVHDLAPGAELGMRSASTSADMIECVSSLSRTFEADVIVDGLEVLTEPQVEDGPVAHAFAVAVPSGASIVFAAGDAAQRRHEADFGPFLVPNLTGAFECRDFGFVAGRESDIALDLERAGSGTAEVFL